MTEQHPVILVFEDIQWADAALLEFLEYLLEWSRAYPIFVFTLTRPELSERHRDLGCPDPQLHARSQLEPLSDEAIDALLRRARPRPSGRRGRTQIRERADGIPLYAVETVRMLLDRGAAQARRRASTASPATSTRSRRARDAPRADREHGSTACSSRRSAAAPGRRRARQDVRRPRARRPGRRRRGRRRRPLLERARPQGAADARHRPALARARPVRLPPGARPARRLRDASRRDRKAKHLAARAVPDEPTSGIDPDEIAEVIAAHHLDASASEPRRSGRGRELKASRRATGCERAGERAASLARDRRRAARVRGRRRARRRAGRAGAPARARRRPGRAADRLDASETLLRQAEALTRDVGATHDHARVAAALALTVLAPRPARGGDRPAQGAFESCPTTSADADVATLAASFARLEHFAGIRRKPRRGSRSRSTSARRSGCRRSSPRR